MNNNNNNNDDAMSITEISFQPKDLDDYYLDRQLDDIRKALSVIRKDRSTATKVFQREQTARKLHIAKMKVDKLLKRGRDAGVYSRAIQDLYSCSTNTGTSTVSPNNTLPPQYVLQRQAMVLQILHKTDLYQHQCTVIQQHSNQLVSYIMCQAAVIEAEKRRFREELLLQPASFINDFAVQLERSHQTRASVQTNVMEHLQMRVSTIVEEEGEGETATKPWIRKDRSSSLGTNDTLMDDTVSVDSTCETTTATAPPNKELTKPTSSLFNFGKLLKLY